ncbi:MAG: hypothetical protein JWQ83_546 [Lacunisphaera sp.]|nr:hypothetical protein [Lacunisphaera sp.]
MNDGSKKTARVLAGLTAGFLMLAAAYIVPLFRAPAAPPVRFRGYQAPKTTTLRMSAGQLIKSGGDASGLECYACHDEKKPVELQYDADHRLVFPPAHADLIISMRNCEVCHGTDRPKVKLEYAADGALIMPKAHQDLLQMAHGRNNRNDNCFNCHNQQKLTELVTREGTHLKFDQATLLCASCHGPTYRDWEAGVHGRTNGFWNRAMGPIQRQECTSCHDPHAPAFPQFIPLPAPRPMHPVKEVSAPLTTP